MRKYGGRRSDYEIFVPDRYGRARTVVLCADGTAWIQELEAGTNRTTGTWFVVAPRGSVRQVVFDPRFNVRTVVGDLVAGVHVTPDGKQRARVYRLTRAD